MITLTGGQFQDASGNLLKTGFLSLQLTSDAAIIAGGQVVRAIPLLFPIANGSVSGSVKVYSNVELTGSTQYQAHVLDSNRKRINDPQIWQFTQGTGATVDLGTMVPVTGGVVFAAPVLLNPTSQQNINGQTLNMEGASVGFSAAGSTTADSFLSRLASGVLAIGTAIGNVLGTLVVSIIKQPPASSNTSFLIADANGISHFFISNAAPYTNTFITGNGAGGVFLGSAAKMSVSDTTGAVVTAGGVTLQTTSQTLPATAANDASGGVSITSNGGKVIQWANSGVLIVNPASLSSGAALTVGGTSSTTGGISIFVGASGAATETVANYPADGANAALRIQALSVRAVSGGLLTGAQNFGITNGGVITGASFGTGVAQGSGLKHQRFGGLCTTAASAGATCTTALTWTSAFADANYTVTCTGHTQSNSPAGPTVESVTAAGFTLRITTVLAATASFATVDCIAIHD